MKHRHIILLTLVNLLNFCDRYTLAGIVPQLRRDLGASDTEIGLLSTVFVLSYLAFSPLFGHLGDRVDRRLLLCGGLLVWSACTLAGSFSPGLAMLALTRAMVGVGEASYCTVAPSIIADLYGPDRRPLLLSFFYAAIPVGSALGYIVGSQAADIGGSWRWALRVTPPIGVVLAVCYWFLCKDPRRGESELLDHEEEPRVRTKPSFSAFWTDAREIVRIRAFTWSTAGITCSAFTMGALAAWAPTYAHRRSDMSEEDAAATFGAITCVMGLMGTFGGALLSKMIKSPASDAWVCVISLFVGVPLLWGALPMIEVSLPGFWVVAAFAEVSLFLSWAPCSNLLLSIIPIRLRASAQALQMATMHLLGDAFSPILVGMSSDRLQGRYDEGEALMLALFVACGVGLVGGALFWRAGSLKSGDETSGSVKFEKMATEEDSDENENEDEDEVVFSMN